MDDYPRRKQARCNNGNQHSTRLFPERFDHKTGVSVAGAAGLSRWPTRAPDQSLLASAKRSLFSTPSSWTLKSAASPPLLRQHRSPGCLSSAAMPSAGRNSYTEVDPTLQRRGSHLDRCETVPKQLTPEPWHAISQPRLELAVTQGGFAASPRPMTDPPPPPPVVPVPSAEKIEELLERP